MGFLDVRSGQVLAGQNTVDLEEELRECATVELGRHNLLSAPAYQMRLILQVIMNASEGNGRSKFRQWCGWVPERAGFKGHELREPMAKLLDGRKSFKRISSPLEGTTHHRFISWCAN